MVQLIVGGILDLVKCNMWYLCVSMYTVVYPAPWFYWALNTYQGFCAPEFYIRPTHTIMPILHMRKLKLREASKLSRDTHLLPLCVSLCEIGAHRLLGGHPVLISTGGWPGDCRGAGLGVRWQDGGREPYFHQVQQLLVCKVAKLLILGL